MSNPFVSPAESILRATPGITDDVRADLFDHFHQSATPDELAQRIATIAVPDSLKAALHDAKTEELHRKSPWTRF